MLSRSTILPLAALLFLSLTPPCLCVDNRPQIYRGNPIDKDQYVWFVAILEVAQEENFVCSGALISPRHVITADHCLDDVLLKSVRARVGYLCPQADNCGRPFLDRTVMEHRRDEAYGDVAILVLSSKVLSTFVPAIPDVTLPSSLSRMEGGEMIMVGARRDGSSNGLARRTETLELKLKHTNFKKCGKAIRNKTLRRRFVSETTICSVSNEGKPCRGDSGSAILVEGADSDGDVIVAIQNYGPSDCSGADDGGGASLFGHVSLSAAADFVVAVVCVGGGQKREKWCPSSSEDTSMEACAPFISEEVCAPLCPLSSPTCPTLAPANTLQATLLHDLTRHRGNVISVAFDATSCRLASADANQIVHVWDPTRHGGGSPQMTFRLGGFCCPNTLAFNPAGTILAVDAGFDVALLDVQNTNNAKNPRKLQGHTAHVHGVAWHPDGSMLASGGSDDTVKLWDVASGNVLYTFEKHSGIVWSVSFDRQGRYLASASSDGTIRLWNVSTMSHVRTLQGHSSAVWSVAFSPDGTKLASGSLDKTVRVWRASDGSSLGVFSVGSRVYSVAWSPDGHFFVSGSSDGVARIWNVKKDGEKALLEKMKGHSDFILSVAWSGNGMWIASGSGDDIKVWEISQVTKNDN